MLATAWSKHCSQAKPTRMPMARITWVVAWYDFPPAGKKLSAIVSRALMAIKDMAVRKYASASDSDIGSKPTVLDINLASNS